MPGPDDMIERVANGISAAWETWNHGDGRGRAREDVPVALLAEAAIRAMREPMDGMLDAASDLPGGQNGTYQRWQAMIDAALPSPPATG